MADSSDYRAWVEVLPDFQDFNRLVQNNVVGGMSNAGAAGSEAMGGTMVAGIGKFALPIAGAIAALGIAKALTDTIKTGIDAGLNYITGAVQQGSDYNESLNAITVAYGEYVDEIERIGATSSTDLGLSRVDFNAIATQFSSFAKTIRTEDPASFIEELAGRGADFASVYNLDVAEALRLFQSGLAGETEPLRRYGIDLSAATVKGVAYANGIAEQGAQLTETQRQQAAYLALLDQTSIVQGDFANTSDQLANQQRILNAQWADAQAELGMQLLPVLQEVLGFVSDELMPIWQDFNRELGPELRASLEEVWPILKDLIVELLPLIPPLLDLLIGGLKDVSTWFRTVTAGGVLITGTFSDFFKLLSGDMSIEQFVANGLKRLGDFTDGVWDRLTNALSFFGLFGSDVQKQMDQLGTNLFYAGRTVIAQFIDGIKSMISYVGQAAEQIIGEVLAFFPHSPAEKGPLSGAGWRGLAESGASVADQFASGMDAMRLDLPLTTAMTPRIRPISTPLTPRIDAERGDVASELAALVGRSDGPVRLDDDSIDRLAESFAQKLKGYSRTDQRGWAV